MESEPEHRRRRRPGAQSGHRRGETVASIGDLVADPAIDALWLTGPNHTRVENIEEIVHALESGRGTLRGIACEKPLARTVAEALHIVRLIKRTGIAHGYLENQVFAPQVQTGHALLWAEGRHRRVARISPAPPRNTADRICRGSGAVSCRAAGVLNDMMCHSVLLVRYLLTRPGARLSSVRPVRVTAHIASLKWTRPHYRRELARTFGAGVDYGKRPSEDFASMTVEFVTDDGHTVIGEASTSWSFVGAGLRLSAELLGPEYSMSWNTLDSGLKLFFSRAVRGHAGEDLLEKQNAESGLMPVIANEAAAYGYENEDRHFARVFLGKEKPLLTFDDGLDVVKLLMAAYQSAEQRKTLAFPPRGLDKFVPAVAQGKWNPRKER